MSVGVCRRGSLVPSLRAGVGVSEWDGVGLGSGWGRVGVGVGVGVGAGGRISWTVALAWFEVTPVADAVAVFVTLPAVTSAALIVYEAAQVSEAPMARLAVSGQLTLALLSVTVNGPARATFPCW